MGTYGLDSAPRAIVDTGRFFMGGKMSLCWYWILLEERLDFLSVVACLLVSFQEEAGRETCSTLQRNSFIWRQFVAGSWAVSWGSVTLLNGFSGGERRTMFPGFCCGLSDCYQCNWAMDRGEMDLNSPEGPEVVPEGCGGELQVIIAGCALFVDFRAVSRCNEVKWAKRGRRKRDRGERWWLWLRQKASGQQDDGQ